MITATDPVSKYMTKSPVGIDPEMTLDDARTRMALEKVRHLPVMSGQTLLGIISARDILLAEAMKGIDPHRTEVEVAMTAYPETVPPETPISTVLDTMTDKHIGAVMIVRDRRLMGIFTTVDACRLLRENLHN